MPLGDLDRELLTLVRRDNQRTHADLGDEVGLSASSVRAYPETRGSDSKTPFRRLP